MTPAPAAAPRPPHRAPFARVQDGIHLVALCFLLVLALAGLARGHADAGIAVAVYATLLAGVAALAGAVHRRASLGPGLRALHRAMPLIVLPLVFTGLQWLVPTVTAGRLDGDLTRFDELLRTFDREVLGVDVIAWSEGLLTPGLADVMMVFYFLYFLQPLVLFLTLVRRADDAGLYRTGFTISLGLYTTYFLYLLVPATGPRHAHVGYSAPLPDGALTGLLHDLIRDLEPQQFDAFPSAHVVLGLLCAVLGWRLGGGVRWSLAVVGVGTAVSTVVLRYHWLVDDLAGLVVIAFALGAAALVDRRSRRRAPDPEHDRMGDLLTPASGTIAADTRD